MSSQQLLRIILDEAEKSADGFASGEEVKKLYGERFGETFIDLIQAGHIDNRSPTGTIALTAAGRQAAR